MELGVFTGQKKSELSMIEAARAILEERRRDHEVYFSDLVNEIQDYLEKLDVKIREALLYFYSTLNVDGSFIPLEDNRWGLRSWYVIGEIDREIITLEEDEDGAPKRRPKRINTFMDGDENAIDYSDDGPEDGNFTPESSDLEYDKEDPDDERSEAELYDSEINEVTPDGDLNEEANINEEDDENDDLDEERSSALVFY